jgi:hypothetical protein
MYEEDYEKVKTPKELYELITSELKWFGGSLGYRCIDEAHQAAIRIRAENPSLKFSSVPSSDNPVDMQNWCLENQTVMDTTLPMIPLKKEPSKEANEAYKLCFSLGYSQDKIAKDMSTYHKRKITQGQVSRWIKEVKRWRRDCNLPIDIVGKKEPPVILATDVLDLGKRTDGKLNGDPINKKKFDSAQND